MDDFDQIGFNQVSSIIHNDLTNNREITIKYSWQNKLFSVRKSFWSGCCKMDCDFQWRRETSLFSFKARWSESVICSGLEIWNSQPKVLFSISQNHISYLFHVVKSRSHLVQQFYVKLCWNGNFFTENFVKKGKLTLIDHTFHATG